MNVGTASRANIIRVFVADSSPIHTQLLSDALRKNSDLEVLQSLSESEGLIAEVMAADVDVLLISSNLEEQPGRGFELLQEIRASFPGIRAVVLLDSSKRELILDAFRAGARGIFSRRDSVEMLAKAVRCVHEGQIWANSREMSLAVEALASSPKVRPVNKNGLKLLSKREAEVVRYLAEGLTNREIAERLQLSQHTVKNYLFKVFDKLGVSSRVELLFMTLSQDSDLKSPLNFLPGDGLHDEAALAECQRSAEQGSLLAQISLCHFYRNRNADSKDLVNAYKWYLIASQQISHSSKNLSKAMTMEQLLAAEQMAAEWISKTQKGLTMPQMTSGRRPAVAVSAASD